MPNDRNYAAGTYTALASLCAGACYFPKCTEPVVRFVEGKPINNLQIAHIYALNENGPRYDAPIDDDTRNDFTNVMLLCKPHHTLVDKTEPQNYPSSQLFEWKKKREGNGTAVLKGLHGITEEGFQEMITKAIAQRDEQLGSALDRFEKVDAEAAQVLRDLIAQLDMMQGRPILDPDLVSMLSQATRDLRLDPDAVSLLYHAAEKLDIDPDAVSLLYTASERLNLDPDVIASLSESAEVLSRLPGAVESLRAVTDRLSNEMSKMYGMM